MRWKRVVRVYVAALVWLCADNYVTKHECVGVVMYVELK